MTNDNYIITKINEIKIKHPYEDLKKLDRNMNLERYTEIRCWNCCHEFNNYPFFLPVKFDTVRKTYHVKGIFCSWECVKRFLFEEDRNGVRYSVFTKMVRDVEGKYMKVYPSPSRFLLKAFGGNLTINEFRSYNKNSICKKEIRELKYNMIPMRLIFEETYKENPDSISIVNNEESSEKLNNITTNVIENWKLKRSKPLKNTKGTLESTMGVIIKKQ
tara:strand:- start:9608 stop:10258 length:651 start_codon:yes stop_codon:yes gene_type:complete